VAVLADEVLDRILQLGDKCRQLLASRLGFEIQIDIDVDSLIAGDRQRTVRRVSIGVVVNRDLAHDQTIAVRC
jgi:hypothetical protein